jgi:hypothetical protein
MTLTRGPRACFPCPSCTVPSNFLHDLSRSYPMRTADESRNIWIASCPLRKAKAKELLQANGLHAGKVCPRDQKQKNSLANELLQLQNAFWMLGPMSDPHQAVAFDELHAFSSGVFGKHAWPLTCAIIIAMGSWATEQVDTRQV